MNMGLNTMKPTAHLDPALPGLDLAVDPPRLEAALAPVLLGRGVTPLPGALRVLGVQPLKHRVGRRCSLAITVKIGERKFRLFAKAFRKGRSLRAVKGIEQIASALPDYRTARVAVLIHHFQEHDLAITEFVDGESVADRVYSERPGRGARLVGKALRDLHRCGASLPRSWDSESELASTSRWKGRMDASAQRIAEPLIDKLAAIGATHGPSRSVPIHRDCYPEQLLSVDGTCYLLDLDDVRMGDPTVDLGNFFAHLTLRSLQQGGTGDRFLACRNAILESYLGNRKPMQGWNQRLRFHEGASLVRLAGVYAIRPQWAECLPAQLLGQAKQLLDREPTAR